MLTFSAIVIAILLGVAQISVLASGKYGAGIATGGIGFVLCMLLACAAAIFPAIALTSFTLCVVSGVGAARGWRVKRFWITNLFAGFVGLAGGFLLSWPYLQEVRALQTKYAFVSMTERLGYEQAPPAPAADGPATERSRLLAPPATKAPAWKNVELLESEIGPSREDHWRNWNLEKIHASIVDQFEMAPGFGIARMAMVSEYAINREGRQSPARLPVPREDEPTPSTSSSGPRLGTDAAAVPSALGEQLSKTHRAGIVEFANLEHRGYVRDREHVAGFEPHGFSNTFSTLIPAIGPPPEPCWDLVRLELVSLLRHEKPCAYVSNGELPQMDRLQSAATRSLDPFESAAIAKLVGGEDLSIDREPNRIRMVGSIRALRQCQECHSVERGALLGAFSYRFQREPAIPESRQGRRRTVPSSPARNRT